MESLKAILREKRKKKKRFWQMEEEKEKFGIQPKEWELSSILWQNNKKKKNWEAKNPDKHRNEGIFARLQEGQRCFFTPWMQNLGIFLFFIFLDVCVSYTPISQEGYSRCWQSSGWIKVPGISAPPVGLPTRRSCQGLPSRVTNPCWERHGAFQALFGIAAPLLVSSAFPGCSKVFFVFLHKILSRHSSS